MKNETKNQSPQVKPITTDRRKESGQNSENEVSQSHSISKRANNITEGTFQSREAELEKEISLLQQGCDRYDNFTTKCSSYGLCRYCIERISKLETALRFYKEGIQSAQSKQKEFLKELKEVFRKEYIGSPSLIKTIDTLSEKILGVKV